jgi:hypothetical protein
MDVNRLIDPRRGNALVNFISPPFRRRHDTIGCIG